MGQAGTHSPASLRVWLAVPPLHCPPSGPTDRRQPVPSPTPPSTPLPLLPLTGHTGTGAHALQGPGHPFPVTELPVGHWPANAQHTQLRHRASPEGTQPTLRAGRDEAVRSPGSHRQRMLAVLPHLGPQPSGSALWTQLVASWGSPTGVEGSHPDPVLEVESLLAGPHPQRCRGSNSKRDRGRKASGRVEEQATPSSSHF